MAADLIPPLFSRRERYSLVLFSCAFVVFSAVVHMLVGGAGAGMFPAFTVQPSPSPQVVVLESPTPKPTPKQTPPPTPTPPPPTPKATAPPVRIHPIILPPTVGSTNGPIENRYSPPPPSTPEPVAPPSVPPTLQPTPPSTPEPVVPATDATFRFKVSPDYPELQKEEDVQGVAIVLVTIGPDGTLLDASIADSSGNAALDAAALAAARASLYIPRVENGVPVKAQYKIVYEFKLD